MVMKKLIDQILAPAFMMASLIIGAGMFSLPYVFARSGVIAGTIYLILMALVAIEVHRSYAEVIEAGGEGHRFAGYAAKYLGKGGELAGGAAVIGGIIMTLTIYLTLSTSFISLIFPSVPGFAAALTFWVFGSAMIAVGIRKFAGLDTIFFLGIVAITLAVMVFGALFGDGNILTLRPTDLSGIFLPLAPILFSLSGRSAISSMKEYFTEKKYDRKNFIRAIVLGTLIPAFVYIAFVFGVTALSPQGVTTDAVSGLSHLPFVFLYAAGVLGFFAIITSYVFLGMELRGILEKDMRMKHILALSVSIILPAVLYFSGFNNFIFLIGFVGGVFLAFESIIVIMMRRVATLRRRPHDFILVSVFLAAMIYEVVIFIK